MREHRYAQREPKERERENERQNKRQKAEGKNEVGWASPEIYRVTGTADIVFRYLDLCIGIRLKTVVHAGGLEGYCARGRLRGLSYQIDATRPGDQSRNWDGPEGPDRAPSRPHWLATARSGPIERRCLPSGPRRRDAQTGPDWLARAAPVCAGRSRG